MTQPDTASLPLCIGFPLGTPAYVGAALGVIAANRRIRFKIVRYGRRGMAFSPVGRRRTGRAVLNVCAGAKVDLDEKIRYFKKQRQFPETVFQDWCIRFLRLDKIANTLKTQSIAQFLSEKIDFSNCPATCLWWKARDRRIRAENDPQDNDVDDWVSVPLVPYVDIFLTDKGLREFVHQVDSSFWTTVFSNPDKATERLKVLLSG